MAQFPVAKLLPALALCISVLTLAATAALYAATADLAPVEQSQHRDENYSAARRHLRRSLAKVRPLIDRYGYWAAAGATLTESIGIPAPGQTLLLGSSIEAARGRMNIVALVAFVTIFAIVGNSLGYAIGWWGGHWVLGKLRINAERQRRLEELFARRGGTVVLLGRFIDGLRQLNGIVAGMMRMPWPTFTAYNIAGAVLWTGIWGLGPYYLGRRTYVFIAFYHHHRALVFLIGVTAILLLLGYAFRGRFLKTAA
ncbi:MAG TPA: DedA family protein [Candidatus Binatia bacterium]